MNNKPQMPQWAEELDAAITICDLKGIIVYMNNKSAANFSKYGGYDLIGKSLFDCHSQRSNQMIRSMLEQPRQHSYITRSSKRRQMICQTPWIKEGKHEGIVEITFNLSEDMATHQR